MVSKTSRQQRISGFTKENVSHTTHNLIVGNCLDVLSDRKIFKNESVDLIVTSPPYGLFKKYGKYSDAFDIDSWTEMIKVFAKKSKRVLKSNGSIFLNVSPIPEPKTKEIFPLDTFAYLAFKESGYFLRNKIIWHFNNMQNCSNRLSGRWETVLWFVKDIKNYKFNLDDVRLPYITKKDKRLTGTGRNPTDVWYFDRVNNMTKNKLNLNHPTVYPDPLIERILKMSTDKHDVVLDPFVGSGTTMKVSKNLERNSIGIEIDPQYEKLVKQRINEDHVNTKFKLTVTHHDKK